MKTKTPAKYRAPLQSRTAIVTWLERAADRHYFEDCRRWLFAFDVKAHRLDLSFDHLLSVAAKHGDITVHPDDPIWVEAARERFDEQNENSLWEWSIDRARETFTGRKAAHYGKPDDDGYNMVWDGTEVDVEFAFFGRSGGWLTLTHFEGHELAGDSVAEVVEDMSYKTLKLLYRYLVMFKADLKSSPSESRIEDSAAWTFFVNTLDDEGDTLPTTEKVNREAAERAHWEARDTVTVR